MTADAADISTQAESADVLNELIANQEQMAQGYRDPSIPEGALLYEGVGPVGETVRYKKPSSMVRAGKVPLPERFEAFDKFGNSSMLPTAMMSRMLSKPRADAKNERAFHTHTRGITAGSCKVCPPSTEPFAGTCEWCLKRTAGAVTKRFADEDAREKHYMAFHQQEYEALNRRLERAERQALAESQEKMATAMLAIAERQAQASEQSETASRGRRAKQEGEVS